MKGRKINKEANVGDSKTSNQKIRSNTLVNQTNDKHNNNTNIYMPRVNIPPLPYTEISYFFPVFPIEKVAK